MLTQLDFSIPYWIGNCGGCHAWADDAYSIGFVYILLDC